MLIIYDFQKLCVYIFYKPENPYWKPETFLHVIFSFSDKLFPTVEKELMNVPENCFIPWRAALTFDHIPRHKYSSVSISTYVLINWHVWQAKTGSVCSFYESPLHYQFCFEPFQ